MAISIDKTWTGAVSNLWSVGNNWNPAIAPAAGEDILIPAGTPAIDCNGMTPTLSYGALIIAQGYTGSIGSSGAELTGYFAGGIEHKGSGKLWFANYNSGGTTPRVWICAGTNGDVANLDEQMTQVEVYRGTVTVAATADVMTSLIVGYVNNQSADATVTIDAGAAALTTLYQTGGMVTASNQITTGIISGGTFVKRSSTTMTTLSVHNARAYYEGTGTLTTLYAQAGSLIDFNRTFADGRGRQAGVTISAFYKYPGCTFYVDPTLVTVTAEYDRQQVSS